MIGRFNFLDISADHTPGFEIYMVYILCRQERCEYNQSYRQEKSSRAYWVMESILNLRFISQRMMVVL